MLSTQTYKQYTTKILSIKYQASNTSRFTKDQQEIHQVFDKCIDKKTNSRERKLKHENSMHFN